VQLLKFQAALRTKNKSAQPRKISLFSLDEKNVDEILLNAGIPM
jgi:hypothetical protein